MKVVTTRVLRFATATGHPLRIDLLMLLERVGKLSPKAASLELGWPIGVVAYHVRVLVNGGAIVEVEQIRRRGAAEHIYELSDYGRLVIDCARYITSPWPSVPLQSKHGGTQQTADGPWGEPD